MDRHHLLVISGPAGVGKGTLVNMLISRNSDIICSVSCTTRAPRAGEQNGIHYFFISKEQFEEEIAKDGFLEYDNHFDHYYGTPKEFVFRMLKEKNVILEIDVNGALNVKKVYPDAKLIFIAPPSLEVLKQRLIGRHSETEQTLQTRLARVEYEYSFRNQYDYVVVNDDLETAYQNLLKIIHE